MTPCGSRALLRLGLPKIVIVELHKPFCVIRDSEYDKHLSPEIRIKRTGAASFCQNFRLMSQDKPLSLRNMDDSILFSHHLFDWCVSIVKLPLMVATAFMKDNLSKRDLLSNKFHRLSRSGMAVGWSLCTRSRELRSSRHGETYDPKSHADKRLQFRVLSVCSWAGTKEMPMTDIMGLLRNNNINGKFDPDDPRKMKLILDIILENDKRLAMEEEMLKYLFSEHWMKSFRGLKLHQDTNGEFCDLNETLHKWVYKQRQQYKQFQENKESLLNQEKIDLLDSIGFSWTIKIHTTWEDRYKELKVHKDTNGDFCGLNETLRKWVYNQRQQYKQFQESKKSFLNQEKIDLLDSIGFSWNIRKRKKQSNGV